MDQAHDHTHTCPDCGHLQWCAIQIIHRQDAYVCFPCWLVRQGERVREPELLTLDLDEEVLGF